MATTLSRSVAPDAIKVYNATSKALRELKKVDPKDRYVLLLPDSSKAHVGMGFKLLTIPPAEKVFEQSSDILKRDILKLCLDGPKSELLNSQENRNIATFVTSHATLAKLQFEKPHVIPFCKSAGGVGIGFVNALVFGGALKFEDGLDFVQRQGQAMDRAAKLIPSGRIKVRILPATNKRRVCAAARDHCLKLGIPDEIAVCDITKQPHAHVLEIAGHEEAIKYLETDGQRLFKFRWLQRVVKTPQAFHTNLMRPVEEFLKVYIDQRLKDDPEYIKEPTICSTYSSNIGCRKRTVRDIKKDLITSATYCLKIEQLLQTLYARPKKVPQPNTIVLWDKDLLDNLLLVNRLAHSCAKLYM